MIEEGYRKELIDKGMKIIENDFDNEVENSTLYYLQDRGEDFILVSQNHTQLCVMFDTTNLKMVGLQPLEYVKEYGERL